MRVRSVCPCRGSRCCCGIEKRRRDRVGAAAGWVLRQGGCCGRVGAAARASRVRAVACVVWSITSQPPDSSLSRVKMAKSVPLTTVALWIEKMPGTGPVGSGTDDRPPPPPPPLDGAPAGAFLEAMPLFSGSRSSPDS
eukprot:6813342-Prymnesium_polylepis.1